MRFQGERVSIPTWTPSGRPVVLLYQPRVDYFTMPLALIALGSALDGVAHPGVPLPTTLEGWAECDLLSSRVAALTPDQARRVQRFEQYVRYAYRRDRGPALAALGRVARYRLERDHLGWPLELALLRGARSLRALARPGPSVPWSAR